MTMEMCEQAQSMGHCLDVPTVIFDMMTVFQ